jgi:hypothetical protein
MTHATIKFFDEERKVSFFNFLLKDNQGKNWLKKEKNKYIKDKLLVIMIMVNGISN